MSNEPGSAEELLPEKETLSKALDIEPIRMKNVELSTADRDLLKKVLERETTSRPSYDGLMQLLSLSPSEAEALLALLRRLS